MSGVRNVRIALAQMLVESGSLRKNIEKIRSFIGEASANDSDVVVFPECADVGWLTSPDWQDAHSNYVKSVSLLSQLASRNSLYICTGLTDGENGNIFNAAVLLSPEGKTLLSHRKVNLLDFERKVYAAGSSLSAVSRPVEKTSVLICADNFPQSLFLGRSAGLMGTRLILSPSSWAVEPGIYSDPDEGMWISSFAELAREFGITTIAVSNVGILENPPWKGYSCIGNSVAVGRSGSVIHRCSFGEDSEEIAFVDLPYLRTEQPTE